MRFARRESLRMGWWLRVCLTWTAWVLAAGAQSFTTTTVQGTVYMANGKAGSGVAQVSWPAFTTAANQAVAAGRLTATIGTDGFLSVNLAPNQGATPAGLYYTVVFHLNDGTTSTEYWVVPAAAQAALGQVRAQVMPAAQAVQAVSKGYVDQSITELTQSLLTASGGDLSGPLFLNGDPSQSTQAATKHYVDQQAGKAVQLTGGVMSGPLTSVQLGAVYQADQFAGADFGARVQACVNKLDGVYGGTCDARNFAGTQGMSTDLVITTANVTLQLPCATIATANRVVIAAGTRNVTLHGCASRGASTASGSQGGTVLLYSGSRSAVQVGDATYAADTPGFHLDNAVINTTASASGSAQGLAAMRTQELDLESLYLLGNANQTGMTLDGTGNYTGGTFKDDEFVGFGTAVNGIGHQAPNAATTDWLNASTFVRLHIDCPMSNGSPQSGTYGINLQQGDGNTFTGGDIEGCGTALHLGQNAQNNTLVGVRNENSNMQVVADAGSSYNNWITGGTMFTGQLADNGTRNSFLDTFHRSFNGLNGDWYGSQQDATVTNHFRIGIGSGSERGLLNRYQTDYGYRWTTGLSDAGAGEQFYQVLDELNNVYRLSIGQYNHGQASGNNQTVVNAAGTGAVVLNGSANAGTGGVIFGAGGGSGATVATINSAGNAQFNGTLQVAGPSTFTSSTTVKNGTDSEIDAYLWAGASANQKESFIYKDFTGASQWYLVKDGSNNWALNSAVGGLDSFKAYQSSNSGDTYVNAANGSGVVRVNYESGAGTQFKVYGGNSGALYAAFTGTTAIQFPGLAAGSGKYCLQVDNSGYLSNTGVACGSGSMGGTVNSGSSGQIAYYNSNGSALSGMSAVPLASGGTGSTTAAGALASLGAHPVMAGVASDGASGMKVTGGVTAASATVSLNKVLMVTAPPYGAWCDANQGTALTIASGSTVATSPTFGQADVGKVLNFGVYNWATGTMQAYHPTIVSVNGSGQATMSVAPGWSISGVSGWWYGHDDQTAIQNAFNDANTFGQSVQFPAGSCMTSTIAFIGQTFFGAGKSVTRIVGMPGQDVFAGPDQQTSSSVKYTYGARITDLTIVVDSSVNAAATAVGGNNTFPLRISGDNVGTTFSIPIAPGQFKADPSRQNSCGGSISSITNPTTLTLTCGYFTSGNPELIYGSPINIAGAGSGGAALSGTITAINANGTQVTISTPALTTVTSAVVTYGTPNTPPWYFGNAGMSLPWTDAAKYPRGGTNGWVFKNVDFTSTLSMVSHTVGIYTGPQYDTHYEGVSFQALSGGLIEGLPQFNQSLLTGGNNAYAGDQPSYKDISFKWNEIPLVFYNGNHRNINSISIYSGNRPLSLGAFFLQPSPSLGGVMTANIQRFYEECSNGNTGEHERFMGELHILGGWIQQCGVQNQWAEWDASGSTVDAAIPGLHINGNNNVFLHNGYASKSTQMTPLVDNGNGNTVESDSDNDAGVPSDTKCNYANYPRDPLGKLDAGFLAMGASGSPFTSMSDLIISCAEFNFAFVNPFGTASGCTYDPTGTEWGKRYIHMTSTTYAFGWVMKNSTSSQGLGPYGKYLIVGDRVPQGKTYFVTQARCNTACTHGYVIADNTTSTTIATVSVTYGTSWTVSKALVDLSSVPLGDILSITSSSYWPTGVTTEDVAFMAFEPVNVDALNNAALTGVPTAPTATGGTNTTQVATTQFVQSALPTLSTYAPLASPALTGTPTSPTPLSSDNSTKIATTAYVQTAVTAGGTVASMWYSPGVKTAGAGILASNATTLWDFVMPFPTTSTKITYQASTADNTANLYDIGIYSYTGTLLCHVGATAGTAFAPSITAMVTLPWLSSCSLQGGTRYLLGITGVVNTAALYHGGLTTLAYSRQPAGAGNTTTGGVLSSSIGLFADSFASSNGFPLISLHN